MFYNYCIYAIFSFAITDDVNTDNDTYIESNIPNSLTECYEQSDFLLAPEDIEEIKNCEYDELIQYHFGLGLLIRNKWIYRSMSDPTSFFAQFMEAEKMVFPDDMSQFIIEGYHHY